MDFRKRFVAGFPDIFGEGESDEFSTTSQFAKKWGWLPIYHQLAGGDALKFEAVAKLPAAFAFTYLTFEKDRLDAERRILEKQLKK